MAVRERGACDNAEYFRAMLGVVRKGSRRASHAGSWYSDSAKELDAQLGSWLDNVGMDQRPARGLIVPHAGYQYCGACGAHAYNQIDPSIVKRIFILGPSHHVRISGCALSRSVKYRTPLYDLVIDSDIYNELWATGLYEYMSTSTDEDEHSIEMQLPFIAKVMENHRAFKIVPILVGALNPEKEATYGKHLAKYLADPENVFVISSDFCHWGQRFRYTYYDESVGEIHQSIQHLDQMAMDIIEQLSPAKFTDYLKKYSNTICGRHPIGVFLQTVQALRESYKNVGHCSLKFLNYAQSGQCSTMNDSSVSYAAASFTIT